MSDAAQSKPPVPKIVKKLLRAVADYDPDYYDMHDDADEALYARLYLEPILSRLREAWILPPAKILDAGCQTGRLLVPLAKHGYAMTGIDTSGFALRRAKRHLQAVGADAELLRGDLMQRIKPGDRYDAVICAEVLYLSKDYRQMLESLAGALKPGGLLCVSHRTPGYYLLEALRRRHWSAAPRLCESGEGPFESSSGKTDHFNWQTPETLRSVYESLGLGSIRLYPIDRFSWLALQRPSELSPDDQARWFKLETDSPAETGHLARYFLVIAASPTA